MKNAFWFRASLWKCVVFALTIYGVFFALRLGFVAYIDVFDHDITHIPFSTYFQIPLSIVSFFCCQIFHRYIHRMIQLFRRVCHR